MFESKYIFLIILLSSIFFQYLKYRNVRNQKFISYLSHIEELSRTKREVNREIKFVVGFESIKYFIYKNYTLYDKYDTKRSFCLTEIENMEDFQCALFKSQTFDYNMKYYVKNSTIFKSILSDSGQSYSQRMGGSGARFARQLAYLPHTDVTLVSKLEKSSVKLLPNNLRVEATVGDSKKLGLLKFGAIVYHSEKRKAVFDRAGLRGIVEDFGIISVPLLQRIGPHCLVFGRFPLFRDALDDDRVADGMTRFADSLSAVPAGVSIHHQLGLVDSVESGHWLVHHFLGHLDSIDLGLMELHQLHALVRNGDLNTSSYTSDVASSLTTIHDLWTILHSGSFSARTGTRAVSRIHLRAHDYHVLVVAENAPLFYSNARFALAKGLMAQLHARCSRKAAVLAETVHFFLEDQFFSSRANATASPIECWTERRAYEICVAPVPTCMELKHPLDSSEATAAAALAAQIRIPA